MSKRILAIDDVRILPSANVLCRTYNDGLNALKTMGPWDELWLDHDLCAVEKQVTETGRELTGYDILCFLEENLQYLPKTIILVTDNSSGREKMMVVLNKLYRNESI